MDSIFNIGGIHCIYQCLPLLVVSQRVCFTHYCHMVHTKDLLNGVCEIFLGKTLQSKLVLVMCLCWLIGDTVILPFQKSIPININSFLFSIGIYIPLYYLGTFSHQWKVPSLSIVRIHQCPLIGRFFKCLMSTHVFTLSRMYWVPWFPLSLLVGCLTFIIGIH